MDNMITMLNMIGDIVIFCVVIKLFQVSADVRKLTRLIENHREDTKDTKEVHERFIIDEEHDIVIDTETNTKMTIFEYNNLILASAEEDEDIHIADRKDGNMKSTEKGYINENNQRNNGKTDRQGTGHLQQFYNMECLNCGHNYYANGHDIWQRKCPNCQGGRP